MVYCNPLLAHERARNRKELPASTEKKLDEIAAARGRAKRPLRGKEKIGWHVGKVLNRHQVGKHFVLDISDKSFSYHRNQEKIAEEAALDGLYVIRTSVKAMPSEDVVPAYKDLAKVERAFRSLKTIDLKVRPIYHWLDDGIRAQVFLGMLAYYVEWHMRQKLAPILFDDHQRDQAERGRKSMVSAAPGSAAAARKDPCKRTDGPVQRFRTLLADLGTLAKNRVRVHNTADEFCLLTRPTALQTRVLDLLGVTLAP